MAGKPDTSGKRPRRKRIEPRELLRRRGVIFEAEVEEWLRGGRLYVYRDGEGRPLAFYLDEELLQEPPWWAVERRVEERRRRLLEEIRRREQGQRSSVDAGASDAREEPRRLLDRLDG